MVVNVAPFFHEPSKFGGKIIQQISKHFEFMDVFVGGFQVGTTLDFMEVDRYLEGATPRKSAT